MELTQELINGVVEAAKEVEYGEITISISGQPNNKTVDIITKKRYRFKETDKGETIKYEKI